MNKFQLFVASLFASRVPTKMRPMSEISSATVLLDTDAPDAAPTEMEVRKYMASKNVEVQVVGAGKKKSGVPDRNSDMLISLVPEDSFWLECQIRRSKAIFKAGRFQIENGILDFVISDRQEGDTTQLEVFREMEKILNKLEE